MKTYSLKEVKKIVDFILENGVTKYGDDYGTSDDYNELFIKDDAFQVYSFEELLEIIEKEINK